VAEEAVAAEHAGDGRWWRVERASPEPEEERVADPLAAAAKPDAGAASWHVSAEPPGPEDDYVAEPVVEAHDSVEPAFDEPSPLGRTSAFDVAAETEAHSEETEIEPALVPDSWSGSADFEVQAAGSELESSEQSLDRDFGHLEIAAHVAESVNLGFHLGSAVEHIVLAARQGSRGVAALRDAGWLIERYIALLEKRPIGADLHAAATRLARSGDAIADMRAMADALGVDPAPNLTEAEPPSFEPEPSYEPATTGEESVFEPEASPEAAPSPEMPVAAREASAEPTPLEPETGESEILGRIRRLSP